LTAFKACLKENDIEPPKVDIERHGAGGRFRMCAGLMVRRRAAPLRSGPLQQRVIAMLATNLVQWLLRGPWFLFP
jgi:hypothetical protein